MQLENAGAHTMADVEWIWKLTSHPYPAEFLPEDVGVVIYIKRAKGGTVFGQLMRGSHGVLERFDLRCGG